MKRVEPIVFTGDDQQNTVVFAAGQLQGGREHQEDFIGHYRDECFVIADGLGGLPHGEVAATLAGETALWGYRHIRLRPTYWTNKRFFMRRIFRSTNMSVWQKRKEPGFGEGFATTLVVLIIGSKNLWVGSVGDSKAFLYREGLIAELVREDVDEFGHLTGAIGVKRFGVIPHFAGEPFLAGDSVVLCTDGVTRFIDEEKMRTVLTESGTTKQSVSDAVVSILDAAKHNGSTDNMTVGLVKRIPIQSASVSHSPYLV